MPRLGRLKGRRLGDSGFVYATGPNAGKPATGTLVSTDLPPDWSDIFSFPTSAPYVGPSSVSLPSVSPQTLLQAAALPGAPAVVQQAAQQYAAANPISTWLQGQIIKGVPNYLLAGGLGLLVLIPLMGGRRRR